MPYALGTLIGVPTSAPIRTVSTVFSMPALPSPVPSQPAARTSDVSRTDVRMRPEGYFPRERGSTRRHCLTSTVSVPTLPHVRIAAVTHPSRAIRRSLMTGLGDVVRSMAERSDVAAAVLVSADGLPIQHAGRRALEPDAVAALAATAARQGGALA